MLFIKIVLLSLFPIIIFSQGYYVYQSSNTVYQLSLNDDRTFTYSEENPIGNLTVYVSGTYSYDKSQITAKGWDSQANTKIELIIYINNGEARVNNRILYSPSKK